MDGSWEDRPAGVSRDIGAKQAGEIRERWKWVEPSVWTERMLTALEKGVKGGKIASWSDGLSIFSIVIERPSPA
jgi:hypothetical protein